MLELGKDVTVVIGKEQLDLPVPRNSLLLLSAVSVPPEAPEVLPTSLLYLVSRRMGFPTRASY